MRKKKKMQTEFKDIAANDFVIFKTGTWNGETFTTDDLDNMVANFNADEPPALIVGHSSDYKGKTMIPAFGSIKGGLKRVGRELYACGVQFSEELAGWIRDGFLKDRSIELSKDNKKIYAVGMLGAMPPAVKGMPLMQLALKESMQFSVNADAKIIEFADVKAIDEVEMLGVEDTLKAVSEIFARSYKSIEEMITKGEDAERIMNEVWEHQSDLSNVLNLHNQFIKKIEQIEESQEGELSEFGEWVKKKYESFIQLFHQRKAEEMEAQKEKEYQEKIVELETKLKSFSDAEAAEKAKADEEAKLAAESLAKQEEEAKLAAEAEMKKGLSEFCDMAIKENRMTPAMRETDEPIMLSLLNTPEVLKNFQQKYSTPIVPVGVTAGFEGTADTDTRPEILKQAEKYAKAHKAEKEFAWLTDTEAMNRAIYLHSQNKIKFQ